MQQLAQNFHNLIKKITESNPKVYPGLTVRQFTWSRNITGCYIAFAFLIFSTGLFFLTNLTFSIRFTILAINICVLLFLVALCRSYMWLFTVLYAIMVLIYTSKAFENFPDAPYVYVGYIHVVIACVLLYGGFIKVVLCSGFLHMYLCLTQFRERLRELVLEETPEAFADKLAGMVAFFIFLKLPIDIVLITALDKKAIELLKTKKNLESALEQQKNFYSQLLS